LQLPGSDLQYLCEPCQEAEPNGYRYHPRWGETRDLICFGKSNKFEARNPKFETSTNVQNSNDPNRKIVLNFEIWILDLPALLRWPWQLLV